MYYSIIKYIIIDIRLASRVVETARRRPAPTCASEGMPRIGRATVRGLYGES